MKYLSIVVVSIITLVSCDNGSAETDSKSHASELDACGCVSSATSMIAEMESAADFESLEEKLEEAHPECTDIEDSDVEENCAEEIEEMMSVMMSKAMELGEM